MSNVVKHAKSVKQNSSIAMAIKSNEWKNNIEEDKTFIFLLISKYIKHFFQTKLLYFDVVKTFAINYLHDTN